MAKRVSRREWLLLAAPLLVLATVWGWIKLRAVSNSQSQSPRLIIHFPKGEVIAGSTISADGRYVAVSGGLLSGAKNIGRLRIYDSSTGHLKWSAAFGDVSSQLSSPAISQDSALVACGFEKTWVWNLSTGKLLHVLSSAKNAAGLEGWAGNGTLDFSPNDNTLALGSGGGMTGGLIRLWDAKNGYFSKFIKYDFDWRTIKADGRTVLTDQGMPRFSPDSRLLACIVAYHRRDGTPVIVGDSHKVQIWNTAKGILLRTLSPKPAQSLAFSPDSKHLAIITGTLGRIVSPTTLRLVDVSSGRLIWTSTDTSVSAPNTAPAVVEPPQDILRVAFSPKGNYIATLSFLGIVILHEAGTGRVLARLEPPHVNLPGGVDFSNSGLGLGFSSDGKTLLAQSDQFVALWDMKPYQDLISSSRG